MALLSFKAFAIAAVVMLIVFVPSRALDVLVEERYADRACSGTVVKRQYANVNICSMAGTWSGVSYWSMTTKDANGVTGRIVINYYSDANCTKLHTTANTGPTRVEAMTGACNNYSTNPDVWRKFTWASNTSALVGMNFKIFQQPGKCSGATMMSGLWIAALGCTPNADINGGSPIKPKSALLARMGNGYSMVEYTSTYNCTGPSSSAASQFTCDCNCGSFSGLGMQSWSCGNSVTPSPAPSCLAASSTPTPTPSTPSTPTKSPAPAAPTPTTAVGGAPKLETCLDVKREFQKQNCCGMPTKMFNMGDMGVKSGGRRLSQDTLLEKVKSLLEEAKMEGGASHARNMAADLISFVEKVQKAGLED